MDTSQIMRLALSMAGMRSIPADSGVWVKGKGIRRVLFAIDGGAPELLLAKQLGYDLLVAHHPVGPARLTFSRVVRRHVDFMVEKKVPREIVERATAELTAKLDVRAHPANYMHEVEVARMLGIAYMNIHLPIDQITRDFLLAAIKRSGAKTVGGMIRSLEKIPEFKKAKTRIELRMGDPDSPLGNWVLVFAAGTNGGYPVAKAYFDHGVNTVVYLHVDYEELGKLRKEARGNLVVLGHMAGDSIGVNIFLKELARRGVQADTLGVVRR